MNDMAVTAMVHLYGVERPNVCHVNGIVSVQVGTAHVMFMKPEALAGFLLAIAESPEAQQYLAQAGAGLHLDVEPLLQPGICHVCGCPEDDHAFGDAYLAYAAQIINDGEARRDGVNVCLSCQSCGRNEEGE